MQNILEFFSLKLFRKILFVPLRQKKSVTKRAAPKPFVMSQSSQKKTSQVIDSSLSQVCVLPSKSVPCLLVGKASILSAAKGCITSSVVFWRSVGFRFTGDLNMGCENTKSWKKIRIKQIIQKIFQGDICYLKSQLIIHVCLSRIQASAGLQGCYLSTSRATIR